MIENWQTFECCNCPLVEEIDVNDMESGVPTCEHCGHPMVPADDEARASIAAISLSGDH